MAESEEMLRLCRRVRRDLTNGDLALCMEEICWAMGQYPDNPEPHNLMGLVLESRRLHPEAMKHFRAAYALDPTYLPARENMDGFSRSIPPARLHFCWDDCE